MTAAESAPDLPETSRRCGNCEAELAGPHCHRCGQRDFDPIEASVRELVGQWLTDAFGFDSRLRRTLGPLIRRPGQLTLEYFSGRRVRYVPPLRLYLLLSLAMFVSLGLSGYSVVREADPAGGGVITLGKEDADEPVTDAEPEKRADLPPDGEVDGDATDRLREKLDETPLEELNRNVLDRLPQGLFFLAPIFAFFLFVLFRRLHPHYAAHLIFSLHLHAFVFGVIACSSLLGVVFFRGQDNPVGNLAGLLIIGHLFLALRRVYSLSRLGATLATIALLIAQSLAVIVSLLGVLVAALWLV